MFLQLLGRDAAESRVWGIFTYWPEIICPFDCVRRFTQVLAMGKKKIYLIAVVTHYEADGKYCQDGPRKHECSHQNLLIIDCNKWREQGFRAYLFEPLSRATQG